MIDLDCPVNLSEDRPQLPFRIPEAETSKDNVEGKIPEYLKQANFKFKEVSQRYRGIQYILAKKDR